MDENAMEAYTVPDKMVTDPSSQAMGEGLAEQSCAS